MNNNPLNQMSKLQYKFKQEDPDMLYRPDITEYSFYQICGYKNPHTNKYAVRKIIFNEYHEIIRQYENEHGKSKLEKFIKTNQKNKYKIYPTYDLSLVGMPATDEILNANSELLNGNYNYEGYKQLKK